MEENSKEPEAWHRMLSVKRVDEQVLQAAVEVTLEGIDASLEYAPDEFTLRFRFPDATYDTELLKKWVNQWLYESHWPWVVVGTDRTGRYCSTMLAVGSIYEVMYGA